MTGMELLTVTWSALQGLAGIGVLGAGVAFLFKEKIKHALALSMASRLETEKASLARDHAKYLSELAQAAELHRVSLIAETERLKAQQHLRTSIALKLSERRFAAITEVHAGYAELPPQIHGIALTKFEESTSEIFEGHHTDATRKFDAAMAALKLNRAFISPAMFAAGQELNRAIIGILELRMAFDSPVLGKENPEIRRLQNSFAAFERELANSLEQFEL